MDCFEAGISVLHALLHALSCAERTGSHSRVNSTVYGSSVSAEHASVDAFNTSTEYKNRYTRHVAPVGTSVYMP